jgi:hypothetical protein
VTFLTLFMYGQMGVIVVLGYLLRKSRRQVRQLETRFWDGETSVGNRHVPDGPVVMRLHLTQDR